MSNPFGNNDDQANNNANNNGQPSAAQISSYISEAQAASASFASAASASAVAPISSTLTDADGTSSSLGTSQDSTFSTSTLTTSSPTTPDLETSTALASPVTTSSGTLATVTSSEVSQALISQTSQTLQTSQISQTSHTASIADQTTSQSSSGASTTGPFLEVPTAPGYSSFDSTIDRHKVSPGTIAAAVIIPLAVLGLASLWLLCCMRRRRKRQGQEFHPVAEVKEKIFHKSAVGSVNSALTARPAPPHVVVSPVNTSYFSGLDTASVHSGGATHNEGAPPPLGLAIVPARESNDEPPPPYRPRSEATAGSVADTASITSSNAGQREAASHPQLYELNPVPLLPVNADPFSDSHEIGTDAVAAAVLAMRRPEMSRQPSGRSISSTLYSSNASVMEAQPARLSVGGAQMVQRSDSTAGTMGVERSPFADPESASVSTADGEGLFSY